MCILNMETKLPSSLTGQEVEDAGSPPWRRCGKAEGGGVRCPPRVLSVVGGQHVALPAQSHHGGVLHLQRALHQLRPGGLLAATAAHAGKSLRRLAESL